MLDQLVRWTEMAGSAVDVLLLIRILTLRLHRTYQFVTLYCAVVVLLDGAGWLLGIASDESQRVFVYSRFLMVVIFPLAAWDCFEGLPAQLQAFRRPQLIRLISGMVLTTIFALLVGGSSADTASSFDVTVEVGMIVWLSASAASLGFVWIMRRLARMQKIVLTPNTQTLSLFFLLSFMVEVLGGMSLVVPLKNAAQVVELVLQLVGAAISIWCIVRLRSETEATQPSRALKP